MTTAYTTLLGFAQPQTGDLSGTWGAVVNASVTQLVEDSVAGVATESVASGDWTLTTTGSGADNQARKAILIPTGTVTPSGTTRYINAPKSSKAYFVINSSTGSVVVRGGPTPYTSGVTITAGSQAIVAWNGSDFVNLTSGGLISGGPLGTPSSGTLSSCTVDGTNAVGYKNIPKSGSDKVTTYPLALTDVGKYISVGSGGAITVPDGVFSAGDAVSIFNNTSGNITLTMTITTAYIGGTDADKATITLATRGLATILFLSGTICVVTGNVS